MCLVSIPSGALDPSSPSGRRTITGLAPVSSVIRDLIVQELDRLVLLVVYSGVGRSKRVREAGTCNSTTFKFLMEIVLRVQGKNTWVHKYCEI